MNKKYIILTVGILLIKSSFATNCILKMAYKEGEKIPLISEQPDNSGVYEDIFNTAAEKIGCKLEISRLPKKRLLSELEQGLYDFYPGMTYSDERAKSFIFIANGLTTGIYGVTKNSVPEIKNYEQIKENKLTWWHEPGDAFLGEIEKYNIEHRQMKGLELQQALDGIKAGDPVFFSVDKEPLDFYLKQHKIDNLDSLGVKLHMDCCGGVRPMYMGFSLKSQHIKLQKNPTYNAQQAESYTNYPLIPDANSVAAKLEVALEELASSGFSDKSYQKHLDAFLAKKN